MGSLRTIAYVLGGVFLCGLAGTVLVQVPLRDVFPTAVMVVIQLLIPVGGGYYGYVQSKKQQRASTP